MSKTNGFIQNMHIYFIMIIIPQLNNTFTNRKILEMKRLKDNMIAGVIGLIILLQMQPTFRAFFNNDFTHIHQS